MTDDYTSSYPGPENGSTGTADTAKDQAAHLKESVAGSGGHLLDEAKNEAAAVTQEARQQLGDLWSQARTEVSGQVGTQQTRLAGGLTSMGDQLTQMADAPSEQNLATDIAREIGGRVSTVGRWLEDHGPDEALDEVRGFARRRPGTFLVIAGAAGLVLGRLTRGLKDAPSSPSTTSAPAAAAAPVTETVPAVVPVYAEPIDEAPRFTDDLSTPAPTVTGWQR